MTNHLHLVAVAGAKGTFCNVFKPLHMRYAQYLNRRQGVRGRVWQGRYFSCTLDDTHYFRALRYVENNPVRAGMVERPEDYPRSSAAGHCGLRSDVFAPDAQSLSQTVGD